MPDSAPAELAAVLQRQAGVDLAAPEQALLFERFLKRETWPARTVGLPLLLGITPDARASIVSTAGATEDALWRVFASELGVDPGADTAIAVDRQVIAAQRLGLTLPPAFKSLYDFIRMAVAAAPPPAAEAPAQSASAGERERVLGAALQLVTKIPAQCRDANGFFDGARIAAQINAKAPRWFADGPPRMSEADMAQLIERWLE